MTTQSLTDAQLGRYQLFAGLSLVAFINGAAARVIRDLNSRDASDLIFNTLEISVIVWSALAAGTIFLARAPRQELTFADTAVATLASLAILLPVAPASWLALTLLSWHLLRTTESGSHAHRGAWIFLALTIPMFWSRIMFAMFSDTFLEFDALLVSWIVGTGRIGNAVEFANGSGYLWIAPACSSLANVSQAILCYVLFSQTHQRNHAAFRPGLLATACIAVVAINVLRTSLLGLYSDSFELLHGSVGDTIANWATVVLVFSILAFGMRNDRLALW